MLVHRQNAPAELSQEPCVSHTDAAIVLASSTDRADDCAHSFVYTCACIIAPHCHHRLPPVQRDDDAPLVRGTRASRAFQTRTFFYRIDI